MKLIFIPGNGGSSVKDNWFPSVKKHFEKKGIEVIAEDFPDSKLAREEYWIPFLEKLGADENTILIGHSSGAVAAMRYAETHPILGSVLVGACYTDLGMESEKASGYYNRPWLWDKIRANQKWILLFASTDDPWIPIAEPRHIHQNLKCDYREFTNQGHFGGDYVKESFPELIEVLEEKMRLKKGVIA